LNSVASEINPFLEMRDFVSPDAKGNLEHFGIIHFLTHCRIEAGAALLNHAKVEGCNVCDYLNMIGIVEISVGDRNSGAVRYINRLRKCGPRVWIRSTALARVPTRVNVEMH
jgi:hypothetical protein